MSTKTIFLVSLLATITVCQVATTQATATNAVANSQASLEPLGVVRSLFDAHIKEVTSLIPNINDFSGGDTGANIPAGDMFSDRYSYYSDQLFRLHTSGGNNIRTYQKGNTPVSYSNGIIQSSDQFGAGSSYYTKKYEGIFTLVADLNNVNYFQAWNFYDLFFGNFETRFETFKYNGYSGVFQSVYVNDATPTTNMLLIYPDDPNTCNYFALVSYGFFVTFGLQNVKRIYYFIYSSKNGRVTSPQQNAIFTKTVDIITNGVNLDAVKQAVQVSMQKSLDAQANAKQEINKLFPMTPPDQIPKQQVSFLENDESLVGQVTSD